MNKIPKVYFAGKVSKSCYRTKLLKNGRAMSEVNALYDTPKGKIQYNGPYALGCDHGCMHNLAHGIAGNKSLGYCEGDLIDRQSGRYDNPFFEGPVSHLPKRKTTKLCLNQIFHSDVMIACIESLDCFGTIAEIGMASALGRPTFLYVSEHLWNDYDYVNDNHWQDDPMNPNNECYDELWFIKSLPYVIPFSGPPSLTDIPDDYFPKPKTHKEKYHEYLRSEEWYALRKRKIKEAGGRCQMCSKGEPLHVHHRTYDNIFNEKLEDLIVLCKDCHEKFHDK
jgi:hypothetical protein